MAFTRRLRRGLGSQIDAVAKDLVDIRLSDGLFPIWSRRACGSITALANCRRSPCKSTPSIAT
ncbi:MAG: hypothetical protein R3B90_18670 [Planctomycetaceae bacterium]